MRQELLAPLKPYLAEAYRTYHGMADLYVYFYELGLRLLRPGGRLAFIVTNKWMKAGYGEPLRRHFGEAAWLDRVVDLGHAKQVFQDADVFPSILVARKPEPGPAPEEARVAVIPRDDLTTDDLQPQVAAWSFSVPRASLGAAPWSLEPPAVVRLLEKIRAGGVPLREYAGCKPLRGVVTGFNEAFLIDTATRDRLVAEDSGCTEVIRPYLRGQDVRRWQTEWAGLWMIFARRGIDIAAYPSVLQHLERYRAQLEPKPAGWTGPWAGRKPGNYRWYELQDPVEYWEEFGKPKILYQDITWEARFCLDRDGRLANNTVYFLPSADPWLLAVLNSPLLWWLSWREAQHGKDEALRFFTPLMETMPIAHPKEDAREPVAVEVGLLLENTGRQAEARNALLDWLRIEHNVDKPSQVLRTPWSLDSDTFAAQVRKARGRRHSLTAAGLKSLRDEYGRSVEPLRALRAEAKGLERELGDLVNAAYGLTPDDVALLWRTAPPRMPIAAPNP